MQPDHPRRRRAALVGVGLAVVVLAAACRPVPPPPPPPPPLGTVYTGPGFDACDAPSTATMSAWLTSPYRAIGIYIGGGNRTCYAQPNLNAAWVQAVRTQGWKLIPIYVGLQAPCTTAWGVATIDPGLEYAEGVAAANDAVAKQSALGIGGGTPVYYDMEHYNADATCRGTVRQFMNGWIAQLHNLGFLAGIYSSASSGIADMSNAIGNPSYYLPDEIWFAHWNGDPSTNEPNQAWLPNSTWTNHQRTHQYLGGHNEVFGGVTINVDSNYLDGAVVG